MTTTPDSLPQVSDHLLAAADAHAQLHGSTPIDRDALAADQAPSVGGRRRSGPRASTNRPKRGSK